MTFKPASADLGVLLLGLQETFMIPFNELIN